MNNNNPFYLPDMQILSEELRMSCRQLPAALITGAMIAIVAAVFFSRDTSHALVVGWLLVQLSTSLLRWQLLRFIGSPDFSPRHARDYAMRYTLSALLLGSVWGSLAFYMPYAGLEGRILILVILMGLAGGALASDTGHVKSYFFHIFAMLLPLVGTLFSLQGEIWKYLGYLAVVYGALMMLAGWKLHHSMHNNIMLRYRWENMAGELETTQMGLNKELRGRKRSEKQLKKVMAELEQAVEHLRHISSIDELTGLANRRSFDIAISREWSRARRELRGVALLMIDVDRFKDFNDIYHHQSGDEALQDVALVIGSFAQRPGDLAARYGGEEFALILSDPEKSHVMDVARQMIERVEALKISHKGSDISPYLTISIGAAMIQAPEHNDYSPLVSAADKALYEAKQQGRNRVVMSA